jgi:hypothetical protein
MQQQPRGIDVVGITALNCKLHLLLTSFENGSGLPCNTIILGKPSKVASLQTAVVASKFHASRQKSIKLLASISRYYSEHCDGI